ncbi:hypothetical protein QYF61_005318 [Mycteria americana]|uniref:Uncharacterized protein n=1 Tax=Mycteria americana TaxID=33587 RepID=A0AAN7NAC7_MYCAM|nr:hypothetical protein QYF61_005318 [Mycteria americana]
MSHKAMSGSKGRDRQVLFRKAAFQLGRPRHILLPGVVPPQLQDFALLHIELYEVPVSSFLQPGKVPLDVSTTFWHLSHSFQFGVIYKLAEGTLCPIVQIINEAQGKLLCRGDVEIQDIQSKQKKRREEKRREDKTRQDKTRQEKSVAFPKCQRTTKSKTLGGRFSSPSIISMALLWTLSSLSTSFLNCGDQNWTQYSTCGLTNAEWHGMITSLSLLLVQEKAVGSSVECFAEVQVNNIHCSPHVDSRCYLVVEGDQTFKRRGERRGEEKRGEERRGEGRGGEGRGGERRGEERRGEERRGEERRGEERRGEERRGEERRMEEQIIESAVLEDASFSPSCRQTAESLSSIFAQFSLFSLLYYSIQ